MRRIAVRSSPLHGRGVFALARISAGEQILEYKGKLVSWKEAQRRYEHSEAADGRTFLFDLDDGGKVIDGAQGGNSARWINHSCTPNADPYYNVFSNTPNDTREGPKFTPFVGLVYDINDTYSAYASYTSIYKPQTSAFTVSGQMIKPVTGSQYEVGVKGEYFGGRLNTSLALFQVDERNRAFGDPQNIGFSIAQGRARSRGVELQASGEVLPGLTLSGGYTYTMASSLDDSTSVGAAFGVTTPKHLFKLWSNYQLPGEFHKWSIGAGAYVSSYTYFSDSGNRIVAPGYATFDAHIGYQLTKNVSASLAVTNLANRTYIRTAAGAGGNYYGAPRLVLFSLRAKI
jgi:outer-membrane receptor for ferric coprogen and ferric-rhodotorulic acid